MSSFAKMAVMFIAIALFAVTIIGMAAAMEKDKPTSDYYTNASNSITGSSQVGSVAIGTTGTLMVPVVAIAGILVLLGGFLILTRKR
jgi:hypothetical protein